MDDFVRLPNHSTVNWFRNRIRRPSYMPRFGYIAVYGDGTSGFGNRIRRRKQSLLQNHENLRAKQNHRAVRTINNKTSCA